MMLTIDIVMEGIEVDTPIPPRPSPPRNAHKVTTRPFPGRLSREGGHALQHCKTQSKKKKKNVQRATAALIKKDERQ